VRAARVAVVSASVPFVRGGAEMLEEALVDRLRSRGIDVVHIRFPFAAGSAAEVRRCMAACAAFEMPPVDRVISLKFPCWLIPHRAHVPWVFHQLRQVYDLWEAGVLGFSGRDPGAIALKEFVTQADTQALGECEQVWTYSPTNCERLLRFNGIEAGLLCSPMPLQTRYRAGPYGHYVVALGRVCAIKRQSLIIEALALTRRPVRLIVAGVSDTAEYRHELRRRVEELDLEGRVRLIDAFISEEEKISLLENALASVFVPLDEDNFGYVTAESYLAQRPVVTLTDSGGVLWLVEHNVTGLVAEPNAASLAAALDALFDDRALAARLGNCGRDRLSSLNLDWDTTLDTLLA
jgi:glycosyltransferase involved in cell wall biosynthesis